MGTDIKEKVLRKNFKEKIEKIRIEANKHLNPDVKKSLGQYFTDAATAKIMISMLSLKEKHLNILDPGAGTGILVAILIQKICQKRNKIEKIDVTLFEKDTLLAHYLKQTLDLCKDLCIQNHIDFSYTIIFGDFVQYCGKYLANTETQIKYNLIVMNPPYKKIPNKSNTKIIMEKLGLHTTNMYTAFLLLSSQLLESNGQLVAITPRSFCSGTYFINFRKEFLGKLSMTKIHIFDSRSTLFKDDKVLQENIIFHAIKKKARNSSIVQILSGNTSVKTTSKYKIRYDQLVHPDDKKYYIRVIKNDLDQEYVQKMQRLFLKLDHLGISVSTGKVVDFRLEKYIEDGSHFINMAAPLIYPRNFFEGEIVWSPTDSVSKSYIELNDYTARFLVKSGYYVLVKRFSSKEEPRRVVTAVYNPETLVAPYVGFENHLNYFHINDSGLPSNIAMGLSTYLNSTLVDMYFRQFNGHTQVNVTDLKELCYPSLEQLNRIGFKAKTSSINQSQIDSIIEEVLFQ